MSTATPDHHPSDPPDEDSSTAPSNDAEESPAEMSPRHDSAAPPATPPADRPPITASIPLIGSFEVPSSTGAIRVMGPNPDTAPIMIHPGDAMSLRRRVLYVILLGSLTALGPFTVDLYLPAFPVLETYFSTSMAAIQLTLTGTMLGFGLGQLIVGPLTDKVGRRKPLLTATSIHILASLVAAVAPTLEILMVARVGQGMGAAAGSVVAMAIVRDLFGGKRLVIMLSRLALVTGVAPVVAPLVGSWLLGFMDWHGIFWVLAAYGLVMVTCSIFALPETLPKERRQGAGTVTVWQRYRSVLRDRVYIGVAIIGGMTFSGVFSYLSASSFLFQTTYGFPALQYGMLFAANSIGMIIGNQTAARLAARFGPQWVLAFSTIALFLSSSSILITDAMNLGIWGTVVPLFFFMMAAGFTFPCVQVLALDRHPRAAGTAASLLGASNNSVAALISPIVALIAGAGQVTPTTMAVVMAGCSVLAILSLWFIVRPKTVAQLNP